MKKDICNRADIELLVDLFYRRVMADALLGVVFRAAHVDLQKHLPAMHNFWDNMIFFTGSYDGNPMQLHKHLDRLAQLQHIHFDRWNELFLHTTDELFSGPNTELAKERTMGISDILRNNVLQT
ncbi:MAG: group hemoglobin [Ferruginibacter sp.]|nr:group hemoglobin [Ferruginibacter sp.]